MATLQPGTFEVNKLLHRAQAGENSISTEECMYLAKNLTSSELPGYCKYMLDSAQKTGILSRRASRIGRAWDLSDGHGKRTMYYEGGHGGAIDNAGKAAVSVDQAFIASKSPEAQEKIRSLRTRMSVRGAINLKDVNPESVKQGRQQELQRRASRRAEMKGKV